jgi:hypothetical protein
MNLTVALTGASGAVFGWNISAAYPGIVPTGLGTI